MFDTIMIKCHLNFIKPERRNGLRKNIGKLDRGLRTTLGIIVLALGIYYQSWWGVIGLVLLVTATISWCPIYAPFKLSTKRSKFN